MNLTRQIDIQNVSIRSTASTALSDAVDMQGFEGCVFLVNGSTLMEGSLNIYLKGSTASGGTYVNLRGGSSQYRLASTALVTGSKNLRVFALDLYKPENDYRYVKCCVAGASSDVSYLNSVTAIRYGGRKAGSTVLNQSTTLAGSTIILGPTSG